MFLNHNGALRIDTEAVIEGIRETQAEEIEQLDARRKTVRDVLDNFNASLSQLSQWEREAVQSRLYKEIVDKVFDFHLSLFASRARERISKASTREAKLAAFQELQAEAQSLARLYKIG